MGLSGNLKTVAFPDILQLLATGKKTGILECRTSTRQKEVAFRDGNIVFASSLNSSEDMLGQMLLRRGRISKADLERAIMLHKQTGRQMGTTLVDMNLFEKDEIAECLRLQIEETVYNLFSWREGEFFFHEGAQPKNAPFLIEMSTMNVIMEGTRRIDEWLEIQKVLPADDVMLRLARNPHVSKEEIALSLDEFRLLALINGERTVPDLIELSPVGEFVTCRAVYSLIISNLIEVAGRREIKQVEAEVDQEEMMLAVVFRLYSHCFHQIRQKTEYILGEANPKFPSFTAQYRTGILTFFPGVDPNSEFMPSIDKFMAAVKSIPENIRYYTLMSNLERMLSEQLVYVYALLGEGAYRDTMTAVKKEISEPLATNRDVMKKFALEDAFYTALKRTDKTVKTIRG